MLGLKQHYLQEAVLQLTQGSGQLTLLVAEVRRRSNCCSYFVDIDPDLF